MDGTDRLEDIRPSLDMTSLVRRVKSKARCQFRLSEYDYPNLGGRGKHKWKMGNRETVGPEVIYGVEDVEVGNKTWQGFGMSRKHAVWNMLDEDEIMLLKRVYTFDGDGAVIWDGGESGIQVMFGDIRDLVQRSSIQGNVIDAYAAMLMELQDKGIERQDAGDSSYVFSSVCSDFMQNPNALSRGKYLNVQIKAAKGHRFTHYPVYHANHWIVMVHDTVSESWKHYNSSKPRRGIRDEHYNESLKVNIIQNLSGHGWHPVLLESQTLTDPLFQSLIVHNRARKHQIVQSLSAISLGNTCMVATLVPRWKKQRH
ncbi:unnamed protein product [Camellia sinensis]